MTTAALINSQTKPSIFNFRSPDDDVIISHVLPCLDDLDLMCVYRTAKSLRPLVLATLLQKTEISWENQKFWQKLKVPLTAMPNLRVINGYGGRHIKDQRLQRVAVSHPNLTRLDLIHMTSITDEGIAGLRPVAEKLNRLHLRSNFHVRDNGLIKLLVGCSSLTYLNLSHLSQCIGNETLQAVALTCKELGVLIISANHRINDEGMVPLVKNCPKLTHIGLRSCSGIGDPTMIAIGESCPALTSLEISRLNVVTQVGVRSVVQACKQLRSLNLNHNRWVGNETARQIAEHGQNLTSLKLCGARLNNIGASALAQRCTKLEVLDLRRCRGIGDVALTKLGDHCTSLRELSVSNNFNVTLDGAKHVIEKCQRLWRIEFRSCPGIKPQKLVELLSQRKSVVIQKFEI